MSNNQSYIKEQYRMMQQSDPKAESALGLLNGFRGLRFHSAPVTKIVLTWRQRWSALNHFRWREFWTGVRFELHVCASDQCGVLKPSRFAPGSITRII